MIQLFDELDELTREPFLEAKAEIDSRPGHQLRHQLSTSCDPGTTTTRSSRKPRPSSRPTSTRPTPRPTSSSSAASSTQGIGLPIDDVIARSDLYEKPGKSPHAFCTDIDREGDVRVLANIVPNEYWMGTMLHELGHSVYSSKNIPRKRAVRAARRRPHLDDRRHRHDVREVQQGCRLAGRDGRARWTTPRRSTPRAHRMLRNHLLIFSRWCQVMLRFEKELYDDPDQDLNELWWDLVERYQGLKRPEGRDAPDYAQQDPRRERSLLLPQLHDGPALRLAGSPRPGPGGAGRHRPAKASYVGKPEVGAFLTEKSLRARTVAALERADPLRHWRAAQRPRLRRRLPGLITARLARCHFNLNGVDHATHRDSIVLAMARLLTCGPCTARSPSTMSRRRPSALDWIKVSEDGTHFVTEGTDQRFVLWGFNYDHDGDGPPAGRLLARRNGPPSSKTSRR